MTASALAGLGIVVTRPAHQAGELIALIEQAGGKAIVFPALEIVDLPDLQPLYALIERLREFDFAIFISPNAVNKALNLIASRGKVPAGLRCAAIGKGSRKALQSSGVADVIAPAGRSDSESLLALPEFADVAGKRIVIFRGDGGRELLGDTLIRRGASVEYAECYRRQKPSADNGALLHAWARGEIHAVTVTSSETLHNFYDLVGKLGQQWLARTPVFVPHPRIADTARSLGLTRVYLTEEGDAGLVQGIAEWNATAKTR